MADLTVANEIARQIGNQAFFMMGTRSKIGSNNSLAFNVQGTRFCSHVLVRLEGDDTYTLEFLKVTSRVRKEVAVLSGIYADQLHGIISEKTGLYLSL